MNALATRSLGFTLLSAFLAAAPLSYGQSAPAVPQTGPASEASPMFQRHHAMAGIMKEMVVQMDLMRSEMGQGHPTAESRKRMAADMERMSSMMRRMSGWADRPAMSEPEMRRQFDEMQREMAEMSASRTMGRTGRSK